MSRREAVSALIIGPLCWLTAGCAATPFSSSMMADGAGMQVGGIIELAVDKDGSLLEVEFHVPKETIPARALQAVNAKIPAGTIVDCEKEYHGGVVYYEVTKELDGRKYEIMVTPTGRLYRLELEIADSDAPARVLAAADRAVPWGRRTLVEKILDGNERLIEFHVKKVAEELRYKILIAPDGTVKQVFREIPAEIEIPIKTVN